ncbi:MAG: host attachment protein [Myxococcales bacterium]|nr:host attachment protein [Myxococcales bacterium]
MTTWVLVAHRGGARLLQQVDDDPFVVIDTFENPDGRIHPSAPGSPTSQRSGRPSEPRDPSAPFAHELASQLQKGRNDQRYDDLVLIAAPRFLGTLRAALDPATSALVRGTLDKDFGGLKDHDLIKRLEKI